MMFGDGLDEDIGSGLYQKKSKDPFQKELRKKLKDRHSRGLSADITSPEEESEISGDDDILSQFMTPTKRNDRPRSAKRREQPSYLKSQRGSDWTPGLGDTLRPVAGRDIFGGKLTDDDDEDDEDGHMTLTLGSAKKNHKTPNIKARNNQNQGEALSKEDIIFGRKGSSPRDSNQLGQEQRGERLPWQPPSFRKAQLPDAESGNRSASPASSKGRKTPSLDQVLEPITEAPTPRSRRLSQASEKAKSQDSAMEESPRPKPRPRGKAEDKEGSSARKTPTSDLFGKGKKSDMKDGRRTPTTDIFGKTGQSSALDFLEDEKSEEEKKAPTVTPRRRTSKPEVKARAKSPGLSGRKTPVSKDTSGKRPSSRPESPTDRRKDEEVSNRRASVLDFLTDDTKAPKQKPRKPSLQRSESVDSITDELQTTSPTKKQAKQHSRSHSRGTPKLSREHSASSVCEDIQTEPTPSPEKGTDADQPIFSRGTPGQQRSDKQEAEDVINFVASAQDKLGQGMEYIEPDKENKDQKKKPGTKTPTQKPKPRYPSKPGEVTPTVSETNFDDTVSIRNAIYSEWYRERTRKAKDAMKEKKKQEAASEEKKKKEQEDKMLENKASYNAWMEKKQSQGKDKVRQKKAEERKKEKELQEAEEKKKDAEKTFKMWKERKDSLIKTKVHKEKCEERNSAREIEEKKREKEKQNVTAYKSWKERKDTMVYSKVKEEKKKLKEETLKEQQFRNDKERDAMKQYDEWMRKKEQQEMEQKKRERRRKLEGEEEYRPAWSPANRTIPFGH